MSSDRDYRDVPQMNDTNGIDIELVAQVLSDCARIVNGFFCQNETLGCEHGFDLIQSSGWEHTYCIFDSEMMNGVWVRPMQILIKFIIVSCDTSHQRTKLDFPNTKTD